MVDLKRADEVIEFLECCNLTGDFYGQQMKLLDWQKEIITAVYGTIKENGLRQYKTAYLEIPKKNGKTELVGTLGLYHLVCDSPGGEIYCCAADRLQASHTYKAAASKINQSRALSAILKVVDSEKKIINKKTGTFMQVLSSEAYTKHGLNPTIILFDELHAQPNRELWDKMTFGSSSSRKEPLLWVITTAGDDPDKRTIGFEIHETACKIRDKIIINDTWYVKIYGIQENDDIYNEDIWYKVNPSLGHTIQIETLRDEAAFAKQSEASEKLFRWLRLNEWVSLKAASWLPLSLFDKTVTDITRADLRGERCYGGLDLSSTTDLTALCLLFPPSYNHTEYIAVFEAWIPEVGMKERERRDKVPFSSWVKNDYLHATEGEVVDYNHVEERIETADEEFDLAMLGADPYNFEMLGQRLNKSGVNTMIIKQNMTSLSPPMKEFEIMLKTGQMKHEKNPVARWCFGNVRIAVDGNENIKPMKNKSIDRIDLLVAWVNAVATMLLCREQDLSGYFMSDNWSL